MRSVNAWLKVATAIAIPVAQSHKAAALQLAELNDVRPADIDAYVNALQSLAAQGQAKLPATIASIPAAPKP